MKKKNKLVTTGRKYKRTFKIFSKDMAMDLGTANTLIYMKGVGIVVNEPSVVAYNKRKEEVLAVGFEAKNYLGRTPENIAAVRPLKDGVIDDFTVTKTMIKEFFFKAQQIGRFFKPKVVVCVPAGITQVEKRAVVDAAEESGAGKIFLIEEPMAAAIGAGLNIDEKKGQMVIDIGGGTTEVVVISRAAVVTSETVRVAGDEINEEIIKYLKKEKNMDVGENRAEECKISIGSAYPVDNNNKYTITGKDLVQRQPVEIEITSEEIRKAIKEPIMAVVETVKRVILKTAPELLEDIKKDGIIMAGGGSLLKGLPDLIKEKTGIDCRLTDDPLTTIVEGSGIALENIEEYRKVFIN